MKNIRFLNLQSDYDHVSQDQFQSTEISLKNVLIGILEFHF